MAPPKEVASTRPAIRNQQRPTYTPLRPWGMSWKVYAKYRHEVLFSLWYPPLTRRDSKAMSEQRQKYRKAITIGVAVAVAVAVACALIAIGFFIGSLGNDEAVTDGQRAILVDTCLAVATENAQNCAATVEKIIESGQEGGCNYTEIAQFLGKAIMNGTGDVWGVSCFRGTAIIR